ncbi:MAG: thioredoxin family protein [Verrucomicrobiaceae bacterium]
MRDASLVFALVVAVLLPSCGVIRSAARLGKSKPTPAEAEPPNPARRGWGLMMTDEQLAELGYDARSTTAGSSPGQAASASAPPEDGLFDFSGMLQTSATGRVSWQKSATEATREARTTGRPLLIFLTHQSSAPAQQMEKSLMASPAFAALVREHCIALRVDFAQQDTARSEVYQALKKRLEVRGYPNLILTLPDGVEVLRLTGFNAKNNDAQRYLNTLQSSVERSAKLAGERRLKLEKEQGYRVWTSRDGSPVFARLTALDANMATFTGEWGESFKTFLTRLSDADQAWIAERRR